MNKYYFWKNKSKGFSIVEIIVSTGIVAFVLALLISLIYQLNYLNSKVKINDDVLENGKRLMETIAYEIRGAKSIYMPTSSLNQLSLETTRYLANDEISSFIDFFICDSNVCIKKESQQNPLPLISDDVEVEELEFTTIINETAPSVQINLSVRKKNPTNDQQNYSSINLTSTVALRNY